MGFTLKSTSPPPYWSRAFAPIPHCSTHHVISMALLTETWSIVYITVADPLSSIVHFHRWGLSVKILLAPPPMYVYFSGLCSWNPRAQPPILACGLCTEFHAISSIIMQFLLIVQFYRPFSCQLVFRPSAYTAARVISMWALLLSIHDCSTAMLFQWALLSNSTMIHRL
jgi:hypothetical protein